MIYCVMVALLCCCQQIYAMYSAADYDQCEKAFVIINATELSEEVRLTATCAIIRPKQIFLRDDYVYASPLSKHYLYSWYLDMQWRFFNDVVQHPLFVKQLAVVFLMADKGEMNDMTRKTLRRDGYTVTTHSFDLSAPGCKTIDNQIFTPDFHYIEFRGFEDILKSARHMKQPVADRIPQIFWRGATTGVAKSCLDLPRSQFALFVQHNPAFNVRLSHLSGYCGHNPPESVVALSANRSKETDWIKYRGILDIDGYVNAWGLFWRLGSGSVVFKVDSTITNNYLQHIKPWIHYVPIYSNYSNIGEVSEMVTSSNESTIHQLQKIADNARAFVHKWNYKYVVSETVKAMMSF